MTLPQDRMRENEELFRLANERLREQVAAAMPADGLVPFVCECMDERCMERMEITLEDYRRVRADDGTFGVLPGHAVDEGVVVVREVGSHHVARKEAA